MAGSAHRERAGTRLVDALSAGTGHILVTGDDADAAAAFFAEVEPRVPWHRLVRASGATLVPTAVLADIAPTTDAAAGTDAVSLSAVIDAARAAGKPIGVVVSDAERAQPKELEAMRRSLEAVTDGIKFVRIVLLGGPDLLEMLQQPTLRALASRITTRIQVPSDGRGTTGWWVAGGVGLLAVAAFVGWNAGELEPPPLTQAAAPRSTSVPTSSPPPTHAPTTLPAATLPATTLPKATLPPTTLPPTTLPNATLPVTTLPKATLPPATLPTTTLPKATLPPATVPATTLPTTTTLPSARPKPPHTTYALAVQIAAFRDPESAEALRARLTAQFPSVHTAVIVRDGITYHRVRVGCATEAERRILLAALRAAGLTAIPAPP